MEEVATEIQANAKPLFLGLLRRSRTVKLRARTVTWPRPPATKIIVREACFTSFPEPVPCARTLPRINSRSSQPSADGARDARHVSRHRE
jgi:hypothetical protein